MKNPTITMLNAIKQHTQDKVNRNNQILAEEGHSDLLIDSLKAENEAYKSVITDINLKIEFCKEMGIH